MSAAKKRKAIGPKANGRWHETTWRGERVLVSPLGDKIYHGTAAEVNALPMSPHRRKAIASGLRVARLSSSCSPGEAAAVRRDGIMSHVLDCFGKDDFTRATDILADACARWWGMSAEELVLLSVALIVEGTLEQCGAASASGKLRPNGEAALCKLLTRRERMALPMDVERWLSEYNQRNTWGAPEDGEDEWGET